MYDNVKMRLPLLHGMPDITKKLDDVSVSVSADGVVKYTVGRLQNLTVSISHGYISVAGSLSAYYNGNNVYPLDRHTTGEAIQKLSDELGIDMEQADITKLEIGAIVPTLQSVEAYFNVLGDLQGFRRMQYKKTLYYSQLVQKPYKQLYFYDKISELKANHKLIPPGLENANLMKYELRLIGRICRTLNVSEVKTSTLSDVEFYHKAIMLWRNEFEKIQKVLQLDFSRAKTAGQCFQAIAGYLMNKEKDMFNRLLSGAINSGISRNEIARLKAKVRQAKSMGNMGRKDKLLRELNDFVLNVSSYV